MNIKSLRGRPIFFILACGLFLSAGARAEEDTAINAKSEVTLEPQAVSTRLPFLSSRLQRVIRQAEEKIKRIDQKMQREGLSPEVREKERLAAEYLEMGDLTYREGKLYDATRQWQEAYTLTSRQELKATLKKAIEKANLELKRERQVEQAALPKAGAEDSGSTTETYLCEEGIALYKGGEFNEALAKFNRVLLINPGNKVAKQYIQFIFAKGRDQPEIRLPAKPDKREPAGSMSKAEDYFCSMGMVLYQRGEYREAAEEFKKVLLINPTNKTAKEYLEKITLPPRPAP